MLTKGKQVETGAEVFINTDMKENEVRDWSNEKNTTTPQAIETSELSHFHPVL